MKRILILCLPLALLAGCLEVDQHPNWRRRSRFGLEELPQSVRDLLDATR